MVSDVAVQSILNNTADAVEEMIEGLVLLNPSLKRLGGHNVVVRASLDRSKVALVSGGGSGHEPSHAGWVGEGMLSAAVCGAVFASPSTAAVLAAILHVTGPAGCLVVVKNYTGDRLNFGLACEHAKALGLSVELVVVGDDCALPHRGLGIAGRRGLAGALLVHKVAGAAAAAGGSLEKVAAEARSTAASLGTVGVALKTCHPFGTLVEERIAAGSMEVGLGIHGEPGASLARLAPADAIVDEMLRMIVSTEEGCSYLALPRGERVALLVNNLGAATPIEMCVVARRAITALRSVHGVCVSRVYSGAFMTSLDMSGVSLSLLRLNDERIARLDAPAAPLAWPASATPAADAAPLPPPELPSGAQTRHVPAADATTPPILSSEQQAATLRAVRAAAEAVCALEPLLTEWDQKVGDGDCGATLQAGGRAVLADCASYALSHPAAAVAGLCYSVSRGMGGTSGVLYAIFLSSVRAELANASLAAAPTSAQMAAAFCAGAQAVGRYGGASEGDRTMLDALLPAAAAFTAAAAAGASRAAALAAAAAAAEDGAEKTKIMEAHAGRSSYVPIEVLRDVPDPGAKAAACWLSAIAKAAAE